MKRSRIPLFVLLAALLGGCGGAGGDKVPGAQLVIGGDPDGETVASLYQMPTPNELFSLVRDMAGDGHRRLLSPASNADRYVSRKARAINFGVYSTDLVYASYFKLNVEVARYYLTAKKLSESLGLTRAFTDADFVRLEANLARGDSLEVISNEAYMRAYEQLQGEDMGPTLMLVLAGGWVESMHLVIRQIEAFGPSDVLLARVAEQKVTMEHLLQMMTPYLNDADVADVYERLSAIQTIYDQVDVSATAAPPTSPSGRMVLGDDVRLRLGPDALTELSRAIDALRSDMTRTEDQPDR
jgi:hypothetical protein